MLSFCLLLVTCLTHSLSSQAQTTVGISSVRQERQIDENTKIIDKNTGRQISLKELTQLVADDKDGYHLEPVYDEYGGIASYKRRPTTAEERETHLFNDWDPALRPKVGEPMPEFVMTGVDDRVYRSTELKGRVVVLSFWLRLQKALRNPNGFKSLADVLQSFPSDTPPTSLAISGEPKQTLVDIMASEKLPFMPVPDSYNFHPKFHVTTSPTFIIIDKTGHVAGFIEGNNYEELRSVLQAVSR